MSSPIEIITVLCPGCGRRYEAQHRASMNLTLDNFDPSYVKKMSMGACPQCGMEVALGTLVVQTDGTWQVSQARTRRKSRKRADVRLDNQVVGNVGLFYICYRLSRLGWNCMPTARNARGIDVLIYNQDNSRKLSIQIKTLSKLAPVPLGKHLQHLFADYVIVCSKVASDEPECYILLPSEVCELAHRGEKEGRVSYWLQPKSYATQEYREAWQRIGGGAADDIIARCSGPAGAEGCL
jgi:hypothetical protein